MTAAAAATAATPSLRAIWRPIVLPASTASTLQRSSQNLAAVSPSTFYLFGGELKPRTPISTDVLKVTVAPDPNPDRRSGAHEGEVETISPRAAPSHLEQKDGTAPWPVARVGANMVRHPDRTKPCLLLWGGRGGKQMAPLPYSSTEDLWLYDRDRASWDCLPTTGAKPETRSYATMTGIRTLTGDDASGRGKLYLHAGCPASGRLATLHVLDLATLVWTRLPDAPGPARGGTVLTPIRGAASNRLLARWGGFCGHELGGPLDVFDPQTETWTSHPAPIEGGEEAEPAKRSVHGFVELAGEATVRVGGDETKEALAVLFMGEGEGAPKELGHDGAGKFLSDVWVLLRSREGRYSFLPVEAEGQVPEARGWFAFDAVPLRGGEGTRVWLQGGLNDQNQRLSDAWALDVFASV